MNWLHLEYKAETPIALPQRSEAGNFYETLLEIPGTAVRGAFAGLYIEKNGVSANFEKLFENPKVRFGSIRPLPDNLPGEITAVPFPVPRSARSCKYEGGIQDKHGVFDSLLFQAKVDEEAPDEKKRRCPKCAAPLEPLDTAWIVVNWNANLEGGWGLDYNPDLRLNTHVGIGPAVGDTANLSEEGRLFSLQHFPAGTKFRGWIAINDSEVNQSNLGFEGIGKDHPITLRVGRRRNSYGALRVWVACESNQLPWECSHGTVAKRFGKFQTKEVKNQIKQARAFPFKDEDFDLFSLTCLTDLILLDDFLRPCRAITAYQIACKLGLDWCSSDPAVWRSGALTGTRLILGWNAAHRLPKENDNAIVAGSVFLFAVRKRDLQAKNIDLLQKLTELENNGIGWRRSEGFGQFLICDAFHLQANQEFELDTRPAVKLKPISLERKSEPEKPPIEFDLDVLKFLHDNSKTLHENRKSLTKTQIHSIRERVQRYHQFISDENERKKQLKIYLERAQDRTKTGCWTLKMKDEKPLAKVLIALFGLTDKTPWEDVRRKANDFVKGALLIVSSEKPPKLKAILTEEE